MNQFRILMGGTNGYGINDACILLCRLFGRRARHVYAYNDFPSVIKGQHQYAVVRIASEKITAHTQTPNVVLALDQDTIDMHRQNFESGTLVLYDSDMVTIGELGLPSFGISITKKVKAAGGVNDIRPVCMVALLCGLLGVPWDMIDEVVREHHQGMTEPTLKMVNDFYNETLPQGFSEEITLQKNNLNMDPEILPNMPQGTSYPVMNGCQAISLGLLQGGLLAYAGYPMTPTSPILEYLAGLEKELGLQVVLPESEIGVIMTALGYSYMGIKNAIGTSGGGFSLMVEALGLAGLSELPLVLIMGQRAGPSTGMPTYTAQTDLMFVLHAGHGEFSRFVVAPGDAEEAYEWSIVAMNKAWKYNMPAIVLIDKTLGLGLYSFDPGVSDQPVEENDGTMRPIPGQSKGVAVKANSYIHDEHGYARENPEIAKASADNLLKKASLLAEDLKQYEQVKVYGEGKTALLCWGSTKGACLEAAKLFGLKAIQILVMSPFPKEAVEEAMRGVDRVISVECNAQGQLAMLMTQNGFSVREKILKYDGRPFAVEELEAEVRKVMK